MPTYEYECKACGYTFERFQSMVDKPLAKCPKCKGSLRKIIGNGSGIIFKGSGFYATDYRKPSYKKGQKQDKPPCQAANNSGSCASCPKNAN